MKITKLAERIAKKSNCAVLEGVILKEANITELPDGCIAWGGYMSTKGGNRSRKARDRNNMMYPTFTFDRPRPIITFNGKRCGVNNIIFEALTGQLQNTFRLYRQCHTDGCVNPLHYELRNIVSHNPFVKPWSIYENDLHLLKSDDCCGSKFEDETSTCPSQNSCDNPDYPDFAEEWSTQDVEEIFDSVYMTHTPKNWSELTSYTDVDDMPHEMLITHLKEINNANITCFQFSGGTTSRVREFLKSILPWRPAQK